MALPGPEERPAPAPALAPCLSPLSSLVHVKMEEVSGEVLRSLSPSLFTHPLVHLLLHSADGHRLQSWPQGQPCTSRGSTCTGMTRRPSWDGGADTVARSRGGGVTKTTQPTQRPSPQAHKPGKQTQGQGPWAMKRHPVGHRACDVSLVDGRTDEGRGPAVSLPLCPCFSVSLPVSPALTCLCLSLCHLSLFLTLTSHGNSLTSWGEAV